MGSAVGDASASADTAILRVKPLGKTTVGRPAQVRATIGKVPVATLAGLRLIALLVRQSGRLLTQKSLAAQCEYRRTAAVHAGFDRHAVKKVVDAAVGLAPLGAVGLRLLEPIE
jgi:hypothetical protein